MAPSNPSAVREILAQPWSLSYERRMTYQKIHMFSYAYLSTFKDFFGVGGEYQLFRMKEGICSHYGSVNDEKNLFGKIRKRLSEDRSLAPKMRRRIQKDYKEYNGYIQKLPLDYSRYTNTRLFAAYSHLISEEIKISLASWMLFKPFEEMISSLLRERLVAKSGASRAEEILATCSIPTTITPAEEYTKDLVALRKNPRLTAQYSLKYASRGMFDVNFDPFPVSQLAADAKACSATLSDIKRASLRRKYHSKKVALLRKELANDPAVLGPLDLYITYANLKEWKPYSRERGSYKSHGLFREISERIGTSIEDVAFMFPSEVEDLLLKGSPVLPKDISRRRNNSTYLYAGRNLCVITNRKMLDAIDEHVSPRNAGFLSGIPTYPGTAKGKARVILSNQDFKKLNRGDILVTPTTRPDFLPVIMRASAIVTNEGGLLSHAAIISREMKKPCVIGTKIATKVFKDGDLLEVDASKGTVKKIKN